MLACVASTGHVVQWRVLHVTWPATFTCTLINGCYTLNPTSSGHPRTDGCPETQNLAYHASMRAWVTSCWLSYAECSAASRILNTMWVYWAKRSHCFQGRICLIHWRLPVANTITTIYFTRRSSSIYHGQWSTGQIDCTTCDSVHWTTRGGGGGGGEGGEVLGMSLWHCKSTHGWILLEMTSGNASHCPQ